MLESVLVDGRVREVGKIVLKKCFCCRMMSDFSKNIMVTAVVELHGNIFSRGLKMLMNAPNS